ncbi:MAG TPA: aldo/keto reductase [Steroidobacteraceae bacterium]|jgi:aryl-alcohol dehydrogenase-like predicted oxidoreductase|nr:aldo/keto reductase [Steroidobacteraceae bacterium]
MNTWEAAQLSRREALCGALAAGAGALWSVPVLGAAGSALPLITKAIPGTGERLPAIGLGTDKFQSDERAAIQAEIQRMQQLGGTVIDTAAAYGDSESLIGEALAGSRDRMFLASKLTIGGRGFRGDGVGGQASFERSLMRLRTTKIDLLQIHNLDGVDTLLPQLREWKQAGRIRYIGITTSRVGQHEDMIGYLRKYPLDFVQVDYSLDNRDAAQTLLPLAQERKVAVLANVPFGFGNLLRQAQARKLPPWAADFDVTSWPQFLLKYVISHPAVTVAIPGSTQVAHLEDNQAAAHGRLPDAAMRLRMEKYWDSGAA